MSAATVRADYQSTVLADNPLAYYALNPGTDPIGTSPDLTGNGNDGVAINIAAAIGPTPYLTNAANFNGSAAIDLSQGSNSGLLNFAGPITLEAWVQPSSSAVFGDILAKGYDSSTYQEIVLRANGPNGANYFGSSGSVSVSGGVQNTNWSYVVLSNDGTNSSLYVNAVLVQQKPDANGSAAFSDDWVIGNGSSGGNGRLFNGDISQIALYNHGLSAAQVLNHFYVGELNSFPSNSAPIIVVQPQFQSVYAGGTVTFGVGVVSALPTTIQWFTNNVPLPGQTNATLTVSGVNANDAVNYSVLVGNSEGSTQSIAVSLSLLVPDISLVWSPESNSGIWDTGISTNWISVGNNQPTVFGASDQVLFDDTVGVPTNVVIAGTVLPSITTVNSSTNNYTFSGSGSLGGSGSLIKKGTSTLTIVSPANFTGPVTISGGAIYAGDNSFKLVASVTVTNNATLDLGGGTYNLPIIASGNGVNGEGAIFNSYNDYPLEQLNIALVGDVTFGGSARWDLATGSQISGAHNLTIDWSAGAGYGEWNTVAVGANVLGIMLTNGSSIGMKYMDTSFQNPETIFAVSTNCQMTFYNGGYNGSIHVLNGGTVSIYTAPAPFNGSNLVFENGATWKSYYNTGANTPINSAVTLNGVAHFVVGDHYMFYTNQISGAGGFVLDKYNNGMVLAASNTYSGPTIIGSSGNTPTVVLTGNGSISDSSLIFFGGNNPAVTHIDVSSRPDQTLTLASGQTLAGIGGINGSLIVSAGATIAPSGTNITIGITAGANATGTILVTNAVTLNGTTCIKLDGSGVNDEIQAGGRITYGGTLNLANVSSMPLAAGNSFQVFSAVNYSGSFTDIIPATPGPGLAWDTNQLSSGLINVITLPVIGNMQVSDGNLILNGTGGLAFGTYYVITATNLMTPLADWVTVSKNMYDTNGNFSVTNSLLPGVGQSFYRIKEQ